MPNNTIYVQYPYELPPQEIWKCSVNGLWKEVSNKYAGLFFRVSGKNAPNWKEVQEQFAPHLADVTFDSCGRFEPKCPNTYRQVISIPDNRAKSGWIYVDSNYNFNFYLEHKHGEVRPRNMAIKIWKCVQN